VVVGVFGDAHAHAEAFDAVVAAAQASGVDELWSLGDMVGGGPDPEHVVVRTRERCAVALLGNHDYGATGSAAPERFGAPGSAAVRSIELARERLSAADLEWMRSRKPAARRGDVQCWPGGPRNAVHEYVGPANAAACLAAQKAAVGLVAHTHVAAAWQQTPRAARAARIRVGEPLSLAGGRWLLNPGPANEGCWLLLDLEMQTATWQRASFDPLPAIERARALGWMAAQDAGRLPPRP
jgi:Calcineurin-like phosphoesterase